MVDGTEFLSQISGVPKKEVSSLWAEVQENHRRLRGCKRHRFEGGQVKLGQKLKCLECGGTMGLTDAGYYIEGYVAAGGDENTIWPGFSGRHAK